MRSLTIISHTEHYHDSNGRIVGLGSTVTEINHLLNIFDEIIHVAMLHQGTAPKSALPYVSEKIKFVPLPALGGPGFGDKLNILFNAPHVIRIIKRNIQQSDYFQFRAPTGIGVYVIPYLIFQKSKKGWFKYAGNWKQKKAPFAYSFQRWLLRKQKRKVTINGSWSHQLDHCLTFENPCLTDDEVELGKNITHSKTFKNDAITFCFVGRLEKEKGLDLLIEGFKKLSEENKSKIDSIHIVGDGKAIDQYKNEVTDSRINFIFHGFLSRLHVHDIYKKSNAIILPSASEGFPKVIAEAMNYGCLPIVSNISSISEYVVNKQNGFLLSDISVGSLTLEIENVLSLTNLQFSDLVKSSKNGLSKFTYSYYNNRIIQDILSE